MWNWITQNIKKTLAFIGLVGISGVIILGAPAEADVSFTIHKGLTDKEAIDFGVPIEGYKVTIKESITKDFPIRYMEGGGYIAFKPTNIEWDTKLEIKTVRTTDSSFVRIEKDFEGKNIEITKYPNRAKRVKGGYSYFEGMGTGVDVDALAHQTNFQKITVIKSLADLGSIPTGAKTLDIEFEIDTDYTLPLGMITSPIEITQYSRLNQSNVWDSTIPDEEGKANYLAIETEIEKRGNKTYLIKRIPVSYLQSATFPVFTDANINFGTRVEAEDALTLFNNSEVVEVGTDEFVYCYVDTAPASDEGKCNAATVSGTTISFGTPVEFFGDVRGGSSREGLGACSAGPGRFAVLYAGQNNDGFIKIGTTTGNTINGFGAQLEYESGDAEYPGCALINTDKIVIGYNDETDTNTGKAIICEIAADETVTCGTAVEYDSGTNFFPKFNSCAKLDTDKFVCVFEEENTPDDLRAVVGTVSGTTITMGTVVTLSTVLNAFSRVDTVGTDQFAAVWNNSTDQVGDAIVGTVSGTTITLGNIVTFDSSQSTGDTSIAFIDSSTVAIIGNVTNGDGEVTICGVNFTSRTMSCGQQEVYDATSGGVDGGDIALISADKIAIGYVDETSDDPFAIVGNTCTGGSMGFTDFSHHQLITITAGGGSGGAATTTTLGYAILATTTQSTLAATTSAGRIELLDDNNNFPFDIAFFAPDQTTLLNWEIEKYASTTGELTVWIEVNDLSSTTAKTFEMAYGNASASTCEPTIRGFNVWNETYAGVWHLGDFDLNPATTTNPDFLDSTSNNNDGTSVEMVGGVASLVSTSTIDGGIQLDGVDDFVDVGAGTIYSSANGTISLWAKHDVDATELVISDRSSSGGYFQLLWSLGGSIGVRISSSANQIDSGNTFGIDAWTHVAAVWGSSGMVLYINGVNEGTDDYTGTWTSNTNMEIGNSSAFTDLSFSGGIDETRAYNISLHSMDILTDYNYGVDNTTFLSFGAEQATGDDAGSEPNLFLRQGFLQILKGLFFIQ